jgi:hypothetical protein
MIIDWLLQEVPQDLLAKLEVYTFGNAANHFNNPHLHLLSQHAALAHPTAISSTKTSTQVHYHDPIASIDNGSLEPPKPNTLKTAHQSSLAGKTIRYIEHYAHTSDFVARWGVLHFTTNFSLEPDAPRYMGRVFERAGEGHQFNQHYLDSMFPLKKAVKGREGIGGSGFEGVAESNDFMDSVVEWGKDGDENNDMREGLEMSYLGAKGEPLRKEEQETLMRDMSPISPTLIANALRREFENGRGMTGVGGKMNENGKGNEVEKRNWEQGEMEFRVRDLSRLWEYRNGRSPKSDEVDVGIARIATI